jgi:large subunit ribosomal protein L19
MVDLTKVKPAHPRTDLPEVRPGDRVKVHYRIEEGDRTRVQVFEGIVIACRGKELYPTFTVRKISFGVGVERIFPYNSPLLEKIEIVSHHKIRRAKLYFLRKKQGKKARLQPVTTGEATAS